MTMVDPAKIRPHGNRILIRRDDFDEKTRGGLFIPDVAKTSAEGSRQQLKRGRGTIVAVGPGAHGKRVRKVAGEAVGFYWTDELEPIELEPGDRVCFSILLDLGDLDELGLPEYTIIDADEIGVILEPDDEPKE